MVLQEVVIIVVKSIFFWSYPQIKDISYLPQIPPLYNRRALEQIWLY